MALSRAVEVLDPAVREAIALARTQGIVVLLVTGRIRGELRWVAGDLHFVDRLISLGRWRSSQTR